MATERKAEGTYVLICLPPELIKALDLEVNRRDQERLVTPLLTQAHHDMARAIALQHGKNAALDYLEAERLKRQKELGRQRPSRTSVALQLLKSRLTA